MTYEKLNAIRVWSDKPGKEDFFALVIHEPIRSMKTFREFYLANETTDGVCYMFGCEVATDEEAAEMAYNNMFDYMDDPMFD